MSSKHIPKRTADNPMLIANNYFPESQVLKINIDQKNVITDADRTDRLRVQAAISLERIPKERVSHIHGR